MNFGLKCSTGSGSIHWLMEYISCKHGGGGGFAIPLCTSVYMCLVVTCWERVDLLALVCGVYL